MIFVIAFTVALLFNFFVTIFGKSDLAALKAKMPVGQYLKQLNTMLVELVGDGGATAVKLALVGFIVLFVIFNLFGTFMLLAAIVVGTLVAKRVYRISAVNGILNKIATYINRLR